MLAFNGEIVNFRELRRTYNLDCRTSGDAEVLLLMLKKYGIEALNKCQGMFAGIYLDKKTNKLYIFRDRFGVKPVFYNIIKKSSSLEFSVASEIKALRCYRQIRFEPDEKTICTTCQRNIDHGDETFFKTQKLNGSYVPRVKHKEIVKKKWYRLPKVQKIILSH